MASCTICSKYDSNLEKVTYQGKTHFACPSCLDAVKSNKPIEVARPSVAEPTPVRSSVSNDVSENEIAKDIKQMATDLRFMKNVLVGFLVLAGINILISIIVAL